MKHFNIYLYAAAAESTELQAFSVDFEPLVCVLEVQPRIHAEMDGSFVWTGEEGGPWQLDGMLYDQGGKLQRLELKGRIPRSNWRWLLSLLGWPAQSLRVYDLIASQFQELTAFESHVWGD